MPMMSGTTGIGISGFWEAMSVIDFDLLSDGIKTYSLWLDFIRECEC